MEKPFHGWSKNHKPNIIDKSESIDGEASAEPFHGWSKTHKSNESVYYKSNVTLSKLKAKCIDIDKLLEE